MPTLAQAIPNAEVLLALEPEELAAKLLFLLRDRGDMVHLSGLENEINGNLSGQSPYPPQYQYQIAAALIEAWSWLEAQGLLVRSDGSTNGNNGWRRLSRRARKIENQEDFTSFQIAKLLPRDNLHSRIASPVWLAFMRGDYDVAAFQAMKAVEVSVREAAGLGNDLVGTKLVRKAFHPDDGALTDFESEPSERQGRADLFAGALASYKNPQSHRDVNLDDPAEAVEIILLANHLLRIVDARKAANGVA